MNESNLNVETVEHFGQEWSTFGQDKLPHQEAHRLFSDYFRIFPWSTLSPDAEGFDMGCGSGRWARFVAPKVRTLHCIDASKAALDVARRNLLELSNCVFHHASVDAAPIADESMDFGYALGVMHHLPDPAAAIRSCVRKLKLNGPLLLYLYYSFDNRPSWFRALWRPTDLARQAVSRLPWRTRYAVSQALAVAAYWPLARLSGFMERAGKNVQHWPLAAYRHASFYTMRTDALDRFGTPLVKRFSQTEIRMMMERAGLGDIQFSDSTPFWCAVGRRVR